MYMLFTKVLSLFLSGTLIFSLPFFPMSIISDVFSKEKTYTKHTDIKYGDAERNLIDIYVPKSAYQREYNAIILFIHGGSWTSGDKKDMNSYCETYAEKGYITATMSYTLVTEENGANAFTMLDEIDLAIKKIKDFSNGNKLNITKIAICGYSAGGHISSLYAYTRAKDSAIQIAFTANKVAPSDFHPENWDSNYTEGMGYYLACALAGVNYDESLVESGKIEDIIASVSPASHIDKNSVPTIAGYGGKDTTCSLGNALATKAALVSSEIDYEFIFYSNSNHLLLRDPSKDLQYKETFLKFCEKYFGYTLSDGNSQNTEPIGSATEPTNKIPGSNNGSSSNNVIKPESNSIPDTNKETPTDGKYSANENTDDNSTEENESISTNRDTSKSGFKITKTMVLTAVLLVAIIGMGSAIFIMRKRSEK